MAAKSAQDDACNQPQSASPPNHQTAASIDRHGGLEDAVAALRLESGHDRDSDTHDQLRRPSHSQSQEALMYYSEASEETPSSGANVPLSRLTSGTSSPMITGQSYSYSQRPMYPYTMVEGMNMNANALGTGFQSHPYAAGGGFEYGAPFVMGTNNRSEYASTSASHAQTMHREKLFIGRVPTHVTEQQVRELMEQFGNVLEVVLLRKQPYGHAHDRAAGNASTTASTTGASVPGNGEATAVPSRYAPRICGFVRFESAEAASAAVEVLHDKYCFPPPMAQQEPTSTADSDPAGGAPDSSHSTEVECESNMSTPSPQPIQVKYAEPKHSYQKKAATKVFVGQLPRNVEEAQLIEAFAPFGEIVNCHVLRFPAQNSRGCGFVQYRTRREADAAIANMNGACIFETDRRLNVRFAETAREKHFRQGSFAAGPGNADNASDHGSTITINDVPSSSVTSTPVGGNMQRRSSSTFSGPRRNWQQQQMHQYAHPYDNLGVGSMSNGQVAPYPVEAYGHQQQMYAPQVYAQMYATYGASPMMGMGMYPIIYPSSPTPELAHQPPLVYPGYPFLVPTPTGSGALPFSPVEPPHLALAASDSRGGSSARREDDTSENYVTQAGTDAAPYYNPTAIDGSWQQHQQ
ncbi:Flowering time control protein FCA [Porphyridium purpureum]|uniref:Flowering time control protein FCA n=1 Tax=Porphyridium purpureum TaxID=35688 RepID=A0A5J4YUY0_PORPP|nr:Flowering time control protein FCA [Porphyridium purpureum]|eukprot:POR7542..scf227_4